MSRTKGWKIYYEVSTGQLLSGAENEEWKVYQTASNQSSDTPAMNNSFQQLARASDTKQPTSPKYAENSVAVDVALKTSLKSFTKFTNIHQSDRGGL
ncbi:hypothetical protein PENPOL_c001G07097 [Penicillium polonicum]|uniref:Uncharacterized protein n=1 Tax=Penicillium polonicum TaxID=60169 RepID=A0A1V6P5D3_PENPO|nr:hypothetical protein PENPOL_c001G07097 [Penicillium polonicum]